MASPVSASCSPNFSTLECSLADHPVLRNLLSTTPQHTLNGREQTTLQVYEAFASHWPSRRRRLVGTLGRVLCPIVCSAFLNSPALCLATTHCTTKLHLSATLAFRSGH